MTETATLTATLVGGPTSVIDFAGLRLVTDPTFDPPGDQPRGLVKLAGPALDPSVIGHVDAVLLSHDHHPDNLDSAGRAFLDSAVRVLTTKVGAERLGANAEGLEPWQSTELQRPDGRTLTVTAVPAQHGPDGSDAVMGPVIGFVLAGAGLPPVYISGDNASLDVVREVADRFDVEEAVLFAGAVRMPVISDEPDLLTLDAGRAVEAAKVLGARRVLIAHVDSWAHFSENLRTTVAAFDEAGLGGLLARR